MLSGACKWACVAPIFFFFFIDPAPPRIYTLSLHDALPISFVSFWAGRARAGCERLSPIGRVLGQHGWGDRSMVRTVMQEIAAGLALLLFVAMIAMWAQLRSEEHTSELQSRQYLVCRLLLEK